MGRQTRQRIERQPVPINKTSRGIAAGLALLSGGFAAYVWIWSPFAASANAWMRGSFSKLSVMLCVLVIAWPAVERIRQMPGGATIAVAASVVLGFVAMRPKSVIYVLPIAVVACGVMLALGWTSKKFDR
jgi:D-arabinose 1-dehydrogenase-like Zn-dependent alcohol dehydrogenase